MARRDGQKYGGQRRITSDCEQRRRNKEAKAVMRRKGGEEA
jgi:hypothetical protein